MITKHVWKTVAHEYEISEGCQHPNRKYPFRRTFKKGQRQHTGVDHTTSRIEFLNYVKTLRMLQFFIR